MINQQEHLRGLFTLASRELLKEGAGRPIIYKVGITEDVALSLHLIALEISNEKEMDDIEVLPTIFGEEDAVLLQTKCLNLYWFWFVVRWFALHPGSISKTISRIKGDAFRNQEKLLTKTHLEGIELAEAISYGYWLFDSRERTVVKNPIFS